MIIRGKRTSFFLDESILNILSYEGMIPIEIFDSGNSGAVVVHAKKRTNEFVVKIPLDTKSREEIEANIQGYGRIKSEGLESILPPILEVKELDGLKYIVMTYLGNSFAQQSFASSSPTSLYENLCNRLIRLYKQTKRMDSESGRFLYRMKKHLRDNYRYFLIPYEIIPSDSLELLDSIKITTPSFSCFAVFDFTPEDVYMLGDTIKYPDPKQDIRGVPIIDISCFSGVARDVYDLPGSSEGYDIMRRFALQSVSELLGMNDKEANVIFNYGRALQFSLSSRFRINSEPEKAKLFASKSLEYLADCV